jgi:putative membrane protein
MNDTKPAESDRSSAEAILPDLSAVVLVRAAIGGVFMGLANLVPGISGGTMLVASGIYTRFIQAIADVTTFRFRIASLAVLGMVVITAALSIVLLAGGVKELVIHHRWIMYSLFIGLTLGGVPVVWQMARPASGGLWAGAAVGLVAMSVLAVFQQYTAAGGAATRDGVGLMVLAGVVGASAMILPGISGGYMLLIIGAYVPVLDAIDRSRDAVGSGDWQALSGPALHVVLPVGIGVVVGVVVVSNGLKWLLNRCPKPTLGVLLGLLVGAVVGLWPFQQGVKPVEGQVIGGQVMTPTLIAAMDPADYPTAFFQPTIGQITAALALILLGLGITLSVAYLGRDRRAPRETIEQ